MSNEIKNKVDVAVEKADVIYGAAVDRTMDRIDQTAENYEKDKETARKAVNAAVETAEVVADAIVDQVVKGLNGEKFDLRSQRAQVITMIDKMVEKADVYYDVITERVLERMGQFEKNVEKDIETAKEVKDEIISNS